MASDSDSDAASPTVYLAVERLFSVFLSRWYVKDVELLYLVVEHRFSVLSSGMLKMLNCCLCVV